MKHKTNPCLILHVETEPAGIVELDGPTGHVKMIPFKGTAEGPLFNGIIAPCGVDTQVTNQAEVRHMSARYMLIGRDASGADCKIYIENNGWFTDGARPKPWHSVPSFRTDSQTLAQILHHNHFIGEGLRDKDGLCIRFYELEEEESHENSNAF